MPRKARAYHYDVDNHDEKIGFPSLEGTLLAISFLTFAVYLIRLVMVSKSYCYFCSSFYICNSN
jgi:hypothetical protein